MRRRQDLSWSHIAVCQAEQAGSQSSRIDLHLTWYEVTNHFSMLLSSCKNLSLPGTLTLWLFRPGFKPDDISCYPMRGEQLLKWIFWVIPNSVSLFLVQAEVFHCKIFATVSQVQVWVWLVVWCKFQHWLFQRYLRHQQDQGSHVLVLLWPDRDLHLNFPFIITNLFSRARPS